MKEYIISRNIEDAKEEYLQKCIWSSNDSPDVSFKLAFEGNDTLKVEMKCFSSVERAVNTKDYDPVYEDNCMEFFFSFDGVNYINIEANANSAMIASYGPDRFDRKRLIDFISSIPEVKSTVQKDSWETVMTIPADTIKEVFGKEIKAGDTFYANLYACADKVDKPYYAAWNKVQTETPDFHQIKYFGKMIIKKI